MSEVTDSDIAAMADRLVAARKSATPTYKLTDDFPALDLAAAYRVNAELRRRAEAEGARVIGLKMGFTSPAKMKQMGMDRPIRGFLVDGGVIPDNDVLSMDGLIAPKVEPEIAFVLKTELAGPGCHAGAVLAATDFVLPALEIIDSRYENYNFDLPSVVADNTSAASFVLGSCSASPTDIDLATLGVVLEVNGEVKALGAGAAVLGDPCESVAALANMLAEEGETIPAGAVVLTGGITAAPQLRAGDNVVAKFQHLGTVSLRIV